MKGAGTDEAAILDILSNRSNSQRQTLKGIYKENYEKDLQKELESELTGDFEEVVLAMMLSTLDYDCHCLQRAVKHAGMDEGVIVGILCTRTRQELAAIKKRYKQLYSVEISHDIHTAGCTSGKLEQLLVKLLESRRRDGENVDIAEARKDAKNLIHILSQEDTRITDSDDTLGTLVARKSWAQLRATFEEYKKECGKDIIASMDAAMLDSLKQVYKSLVLRIEDPILYYTELLHSCIDGLGTKDSMLIRILVSRSEIDLEDIKCRYKSVYQKSLRDSIENDCSGDYKRMLLAIVGDNNGV